MSDLKRSAKHMIRYLTSRDREVFTVIRMEGLTSDPDAFGETFEDAKRRSDGEWSAWLSEAIVPEEKNVIVIEEGGRTVGVCGFGLSDEDRASGYLWGMFVSPVHRKKSHGRLLLDEVEKWLKQRGRTKLRACVAAPNGDAVAFYRKCGFTVGAASGSLRPGSAIPVYPIEKQI